MASHLWFWAFWHWSEESHRAGELLRSPIQGIGGNWDEWYRHEATDAERAAIATCGRHVAGQRSFVSWLVRRWGPGAESLGRRPPVRFVLSQLSALAPFDEWKAMARYRTDYGRGGVSAVVLAEGSDGNAMDVRRVHALLVPASAPEPSVVAEGFRGDVAELQTALDATGHMLRGRGLIRLLGYWLVAGRRPYPTWMQWGLSTGWAATALLIVWTVAGADPGKRLPMQLAVLGILWLTLALIGTCASLATVWFAIAEAKEWRRCLDAHQLRLRMDGGLTLIGGSAGLAFSLNTLAAIARVGTGRRRSWFWRRVSEALRDSRAAWAATGVIESDGRIGAVVVAPKARACLEHPRVQHLLAPRQPQRAPAIETPAPARVIPSVRPSLGDRTSSDVRLGYAAESPALRAHRCRDLAEAILTLGGLTGARPIFINLAATITSVVMLLALSDIQGVLLPPPAPFVAGPASTSPYQMQLTLPTRQPQRFTVVLESGFWTNRRANVEASQGAGEPAIADVRLTRLANQLTHDVEDGAIYVERRLHFLGREFASGERVGRYSLASLMQDHD